MTEQAVQIIITIKVGEESREIEHRIPTSLAPNYLENR